MSHRSKYRTKLLLNLLSYTAHMLRCVLYSSPSPFTGFAPMRPFPCPCRVNLEPHMNISCIVCFHICVERLAARKPLSNHRRSLTSEALITACPAATSASREVDLDVLGYVSPSFVADGAAAHDALLLVVETFSLVSPIIS